MKKIKLYSLALVALTLYILSSSDTFLKSMRKKWNNEHRPVFLHWNRYKYGDLYGVSYLGDYKHYVPPDYSTLESSHADTTKADLWVIGDSYLAKMNGGQDNFACGNFRIRHIFWFDNEKPGAAYSPDPKRPNILLVELSERFISGRLLPAKVMQYLDCYQLPGKQKTQPPRENLLTVRFVPETIEENIETLLFGYEMFSGLKEIKAKFNYEWLGRCDKQVYVSEEQGRLFFSSTVNPKSSINAFAPVDDKKIEAYVQGLNSLRQEFLKAGFDEVIVSLIPNAVTITPPAGLQYNELIPRIQRNEKLEVPVIDVYTKMISHPNKEGLYWKSDTHWSREGFLLWKSCFDSTMNGIIMKK